MNCSVPLLTGRRAWLTAGALSVLLTGGLTAQLIPTALAASAEGPVVRAAAQTAPALLRPTAPALTIVGPSAPAVVPAADVPADLPVPAVASKPAAPRAAAKPAQRPARTPAATGSDVCSGSDWQTVRGSRALASLRHPTPSGVSVSFRGGRSGYLGLTYPARHHVDVFVRSCGAESWTLLRHVMAHEMGHAYDAAHMSAADRAAYEAMRGIPAGTPWFGCSYCSDFATPAGDFAETYAQWQRGASDSRTQIARVPGAAQLAVLGARFFSR